MVVEGRATGERELAMTEKKALDGGQDVSRWQKPIEELCCVNGACPRFGQRGAGNLSVRKGKGSRWRMLRCSACKGEFSERAGTALFDSRLPPEKFISVAEHLKEQVGVRATARLVGVSTAAVTRIGLLGGSHARQLHELLAQKLDVDEVQLDEKWGFVKKNRRTASRPGTKRPDTETSGTT
jgi:transposase-like protein